MVRLARLKLLTGPTAPHRLHLVHLFSRVNTVEPLDSIHSKVLGLGLEERFVQAEVVDCTDTQEPVIGVAGSFAKHQRPACLAETVSHAAPGDDRLILAEESYVVFASHKASVFVECREVGREHGSRDLAAVDAAAEKGEYKARCFEWLASQQMEGFVFDLDPQLPAGPLRSNRSRKPRPQSTIRLWRGHCSSGVHPDGLWGCEVALPRFRIEVTLGNKSGEGWMASDR